MIIHVIFFGLWFITTFRRAWNSKKWTHSNTWIFMICFLCSVRSFKKEILTSGTIMCNVLSRSYFIMSRNIKYRLIRNCMILCQIFCYWPNTWCMIFNVRYDIKSSKITNYFNDDSNFSFANLISRWKLGVFILYNPSYNCFHFLFHLLLTISWMLSFYITKIAQKTR